MFKFQTENKTANTVNTKFSPKTIIGLDNKEVQQTKNGEWSQNASEEMKEVLNAMLLTPTGTRMYNEMKNCPTEITISISDEESEDYAVTIGSRKNDTIRLNGKEYNRTAHIEIYRNKILGEGSRFGSWLEGLNAVGTHEAVHASNPEQRIKDIAASNTWETERFPLDTEYESRLEFHELLEKGVIDLSPDDWTLTSPYINPTEKNVYIIDNWQESYHKEGQVKNKKKGGRKPGYYGLDEKGKSRTKVRPNPLEVDLDMSKEE